MRQWRIVDLGGHLMITRDDTLIATLTDEYLDASEDDTESEYYFAQFIVDACNLKEATDAGALLGANATARLRRLEAEYHATEAGHTPEKEPFIDVLRRLPDVGDTVIDPDLGY